MAITDFISPKLSEHTSLKICEPCLSFWLALLFGSFYSMDLYEALGYASITYIFNKIRFHFISEL
jgi:hypothetical protein